MKILGLDIVLARRVRRAVVEAGDIEGDIKFQNDINGLLAQLEERATPLAALGWLTTPGTEGRPSGGRRRAASSRGLHIVADGGVETETGFDVPTAAASGTETLSDADGLEPWTAAASQG